MFVGLTRTKRLRAGWIIALAYLFCVLAPTLSVALPGSHAIAYCLTDDDHTPGLLMCTVKASRSMFIGMVRSMTMRACKPMPTQRAISM